MKNYNNFKKQAQIIYRVAIQTKGQEFEYVLQSKAYIFHTLHGIIDGLVISGVCTTEEIAACHNYAKVVEKAFDKNHIEPWYNK